MSGSFIPALRFHVLTPLFDPFMAFTLPDRKIKSDLVEKARLGSGDRVLDFGCGTATLTILIKRRYPGALVRGLDVDEAILAKASRKAEADGADVGFDVYDGGRFPYPDGSFDRVVTCFVLHHLDDRGKKTPFARPSECSLPGGNCLLRISIARGIPCVERHSRPSVSWMAARARARMRREGCVR